MYSEPVWRFLAKNRWGWEIRVNSEKPCYPHFSLHLCFTKKRLLHKPQRPIIVTESWSSRWVEKQSVKCGSHDFNQVLLERYIFTNWTMHLEKINWKKFPQPITEGNILHFRKVAVFYELELGVLISQHLIKEPDECICCSRWITGLQEMFQG